MQVINRIRKKADSSTKVEIVANILLRAVTSFFWTSVSNDNNFFLRLSNLLQQTLIFTPQNSDVEISQLIKDGRCFHYKQKGYTMLNYLKNEGFYINK